MGAGNWLWWESAQVTAVRAISYRGQGYSGVGASRRFVLPPQLRKAVKESSENNRVLCLTRHERWNCLAGFGLSRLDDFAAQLDREEAHALTASRDFDRDLRATQLYGFSEVPFDDSGRFVLPDHLADLAGVADALYFHGAGPFFTLWNPDNLAKMGEGWEGAQAACAHLAAEQAKIRK